MKIKKRMSKKKMDRDKNIFCYINRSATNVKNTFIENMKVFFVNKEGFM